MLKGVCYTKSKYYCLFDLLPLCQYHDLHSKTNLVIIVILSISFLSCDRLNIPRTEWCQEPYVPVSRSRDLAFHVKQNNLYKRVKMNLKRPICLCLKKNEIKIIDDRAHLVFEILVKF